MTTAMGRKPARPLSWFGEPIQKTSILIYKEADILLAHANESDRGDSRAVRRLWGTHPGNATRQGGGRPGRGPDPGVAQRGDLAGRRAVPGAVRLERAAHGGLRLHAQSRRVGQRDRTDFRL